MVPNVLGREFRLQSRQITEILGTPTPHDVIMPGAYLEYISQISSPMYEMFILASISAILKPQSIFEIGTHVGVSALTMAKNVPEHSQIFTLDLPAERLAENNVMNPDNVEVPYIVGEAFRGDPDGVKVTQLYGDSLEFDFSPYHDSMDLIFIDGNHEYQFVKSDSVNAFKMLKPGGCIVWDDYFWEYGSFWCSGVTQYLNEISNGKEIYRIAGTRLGIYYEMKE